MRISLLQMVSTILLLAAAAASRAQGLADDFSGNEINPQKWLIKQAPGGSWKIGEGALKFESTTTATQWNTWSVSSQTSFPRTNERGQCLRVTFDVKQSAGSMYVAGLAAANGEFDFKQMNYLFHDTGTQICPLAWTSFGSEWKPTLPNAGIKSWVSLRLTLDGAKGALYEMNDGIGWNVLRDERGRQGDASTSYRFAVLVANPQGQPSQTMWLDNVRVEYVDAPPAAKPIEEVPASISVSTALSMALERKEKVDLAGEWDFHTDPDNSGQIQKWYETDQKGVKVQVPLPWQLAAPQFSDYAGAAWYMRTVKLPGSFANKRILLVSHGIATDARVWINGHYAGERRSVSQNPFAIDITAFAKPGENNSIAIRVVDPPGGFIQALVGVRASGLWHPIWIEATGQSHIADAYIKTDLDQSSATARLQIQTTATEGNRLQARITCTAPGGETSESIADLQSRAGQQENLHSISVPLKLAKAVAWSPEEPQLYHAEIKLSAANGEILDQGSVDFAFRKLENRDKHIWLNNKPYYLIGGGLDPGPYGGMLDVNWHQPPPYHPMTDEEIQKNIRAIKSLGINFVRCTLRPAPPRFLYWADRLGLLVWQESPWYEGYLAGADQHVDPVSFGKFERQCAEVMLRDRNHPSLAMYGLFNEGIPIKIDPEKPLRELFDLLKSLNPGCFILDTSGGKQPGVPNFPENHPCTDIEDVHTYPHFYQFTEAHDFFKTNRSYGKPVLITEFGSIPYIHDIDKIRRIWGGKLPPWATAMGSAYATYFNGGYEDRFYRWGLDKVFGGMHAFAQACDSYYYEGLKLHTEYMRLNPEISGNVAWICESWPHPTGVFDYFLDRKNFADDLAKVWTQDLVIPEIEGRRNFWSGETVRVNLHVSHYGDAQPLKAAIHWRLEGTDLAGDLDEAGFAASDVTTAGTIKFQAPEVNKPLASKLIVQLHSGDKVYSENEIRVYFYPAAWRVPAKARFSSEIDSRRFETAPPGTGVLVTTRLNDETTQALAKGETVLLLADSSSAAALRRHGLVLAGREQSIHTATYFIKKDQSIGKESGPKLFDRIPFDNPLTWPFKTVWPKHTLFGIKPEQKDDMLAGAFGMMISFKPRDENGNEVNGEVNATILQCRLGSGRLLIATFNLLDGYLDDPVSTIMLNDLIDYASRGFEPAFVVEINLMLHRNIAGACAALAWIIFQRGGIVFHIRTDAPKFKRHPIRRRAIMKWLAIEWIGLLFIQISRNQFIQRRGIVSLIKLVSSQRRGHACLIEGSAGNQVTDICIHLIVFELKQS